MNGNSFQCDKRYFCKQIEKQIKFIIDIVGDCCTDFLVSDIFKVRIKVFQPFLELLIKQISQVKIDKIKWEFQTSSRERMSNIIGYNHINTFLSNSRSSTNHEWKNIIEKFQQKSKILFSNFSLHF